jgi:microcystin-dependent protein
MGDRRRNLGIPSGVVFPFAGNTAPYGYLVCDGRAVSRTEFGSLFLMIGTSHGAGDGSTTFNLPDYRGNFLRGKVDITTIAGSGTVPVSPGNNQATFTNHGINRTGFKVRLSSGTLGGLSASTDYFAIVVDANTLAFATSLANALAGTRITLTSGGTNTGVIVQYEDPDAATRAAVTVGGSSGNNVGSIQGEMTGNHTHLSSAFSDNGWPSGSGDRQDSYYFMNASKGTDYQLPINGNGGTETRPKNMLVNYIIKV